MSGGIDNRASVDESVLADIGATLAAIKIPSKELPSKPKYEVRHYSNLGGFLIVSVPNGSAIASVRQSNGRGEVSQITAPHFPEFLLDLEGVLEQAGRKLVKEIPTHPNNGFGEGENIYDALAGIPLGTGESQYRL